MRQRGGRGRRGGRQVSAVGSRGGRRRRGRRQYRHQSEKESREPVGATGPASTGAQLTRGEHDRRDKAAPQCTEDHQQQPFETAVGDVKGAAPPLHDEYRKCDQIGREAEALDARGQVAPYGRSRRVHGWLLGADDVSSKRHELVGAMTTSETGREV